MLRDPKELQRGAFMATLALTTWLVSASLERRKEEGEVESTVGIAGGRNSLLLVGLAGPTQVMIRFHRDGEMPRERGRTERRSRCGQHPDRIALARSHVIARKRPCEHDEASTSAERSLAVAACASEHVDAAESTDPKICLLRIARGWKRDCVLVCVSDRRAAGVVFRFPH